MKIVQSLTENDFIDFIQSTDKPIMVDFYADWCSPCRMQANIFYEMANDLKDRVIFAKVDIDNNESLAYTYKITSVPCIMVFKGGRVLQKVVGLSTKAELAEMLIKYV